MHSLSQLQRAGPPCSFVRNGRPMIIESFARMILYGHCAGHSRYSFHNEHHFLWRIALLLKCWGRNKVEHSKCFWLDQMQVSILLVWLGLNHPQRITTQLYVVLTAPLFLQLFDGQITAPLSPFSKGREGWTILFWFYRFVETQTRRWWNLQDRGVTVLFVTCLLWIRSQNSAINLINGHVALNSKYGLI